VAVSGKPSNLIKADVQHFSDLSRTVGRSNVSLDEGDVFINASDSVAPSGESVKIT